MSEKYSDYIIYVDESGDHSLESINKDYPIFVLAFCILGKESYSQSGVKKLKDFKFKHFGHYMVILHENEIRRDKGWFKNLNLKELKDNFLNELTGLQLADLVARPIGLHVLKPQQENRAYEILKKKFHNKNGSYNGVGLKIFP